MEDFDNVKMAKLLEDRMNTIEGTYGNSFLESPISVLQSRMITDTEDLGLNYLLNFQTVRYGEAMNMGIYAQEFYPCINNSNKYKEALSDAIALDASGTTFNFERLPQRRRSLRTYSNKKMSFDVFSRILRNSQNMRDVNRLLLKNTLITFLFA